MFSPWKKTNKQNDHKIKKKKIREIGTRSGTGSAAVPRGPLGASWSNCNCPGIISLVGAGGASSTLISGYSLPPNAMVPSLVGKLIMKVADKKYSFLCPYTFRQENVPKSSFRNHCLLPLPTCYQRVQIHNC